jgi:hypothetical protein
MTYTAKRCQVRLLTSPDTVFLGLEPVARHLLYLR